MSDGFTDNFRIMVPIIENVAAARSLTRKKKEKRQFTPENKDLRDFPTTICVAFRKLTLQYDAPQMALTAAEIFSLVVGLKYMSKNRGEVEIKPTLTYFKRTLNVLKAKFSCTNSLYSQPEM